MFVHFALVYSIQQPCHHMNTHTLIFVFDFIALHTYFMNKNQVHLSIKPIKCKANLSCVSYPPVIINFFIDIQFSYFSHAAVTSSKQTFVTQILHRRILVFALGHALQLNNIFLKLFRRYVLIWLQATEICPIMLWYIYFKLESWYMLQLNTTVLTRLLQYVLNNKT